MSRVDRGGGGPLFLGSAGVLQLHARPCCGHVERRAAEAAAMQARAEAAEEAQLAAEAVDAPQPRVSQDVTFLQTH
eukprot:4084024-Prymnesium_polylepis.1